MMAISFTRSPNRALAVLSGLLLGGTVHAECAGPLDQSDLLHARDRAAAFYETPLVLDLRTDVTTAEIAELSPFLTGALTDALMRFAEGRDSAEASVTTASKSSIASGPIFHSNYEGAAFVGVQEVARGAGRQITAEIALTYKSSQGNADWTDVAVLRCEHSTWSVDDILFDAAQNQAPSLRAWLAVD